MSGPINPESSKGERIKDPPTPSERLSEVARMKEGLPPPPPAWANDQEVAVWLQDLAKAGVDRLVLFCQPDIWNEYYDPPRRARLQTFVGQLKRDIDDENKRRREAEANERAAKQRDELRDMLRSWRSE